MSSNDSHIKPTPNSRLSDYLSSRKPTTTPYIPSEIEARCYLAGLPSKARFIARSSPDIWKIHVGAFVCLELRELKPFGPHPLNSVWEDVVGPAMVRHLQEKQVHYSVLNPVRFGLPEEPLPSAFIFVGVAPLSLTFEKGGEIAMHCRSILSQNGIDDVHVLIYESQFTRAAAMYKSAYEWDPNRAIREPFTASLGIPLCSAATPAREGTGAFFFLDPAKPDALFLLTARHVIFDPDQDDNLLYEFREDTSQPKRDVLLMGTSAFAARCKAIRSEMEKKRREGESIEHFLASSENTKDEGIKAKRKTSGRELEEIKSAVEACERLLSEIAENWKDEGQRILGHVILSPPLAQSRDGFIEDWAIVQINPAMLDKTNFIPNAIDVSIIDFFSLHEWIVKPTFPDQVSPKHPKDDFIALSRTVSDDDLFGTSPLTPNQGVTVLKNGNATRLTAGRLNTIRAFVRAQPSDDAPSKALAVLPRSSITSVWVNGCPPNPGPFAQRGDSGAVVVTGTGMVCGMLTGVDGAEDTADCAYLTSIDFLLGRLKEFGIDAQISFTCDDM